MTIFNLGLHRFDEPQNQLVYNVRVGPFQIRVFSKFRFHVAAKVIVARFIHRTSWIRC